MIVILLGNTCYKWIRDEFQPSRLAEVTSRAVITFLTLY